MRKVIAMGGEPATGKSTIIRRLMDGHEWSKREPEKTLVAHYNLNHDTYILGDYSDADQPFPGTDRLSMAVQPQALKFLESTQGNVIFEGDRLFNRSLLEKCAEWADDGKIEFRILIVHATKQIKEQRHTDRHENGVGQSEQFLGAKETKIENVGSSLVLMGYIERVQNNTPQELDQIVNDLRGLLLMRD